MRILLTFMVISVAFFTGSVFYVVFDDAIHSIDMAFSIGSAVCMGLITLSLIVLAAGLLTGMFAS